jgi:phenylalanyl-tRNA synthetase alpha chain
LTKTNPIQTIKDLTQSALGDINSAATLADLEKVRVAVLGRKGELAGISKTFGAMAPEDRAKAGQLLRTHTSPVQVRALQKYGAPMRMIAPGRVFRNEEVDASHEHTFYQVEGMMVDRDVSVSHLIYFMQTLLSSVFGRKVTVRLRPGYFPFVEPGFELDIQCLICGGNGCAVCKQSGWVELLPCGLVHPNVISNCGLDSLEWNGFAFGLGLTRLAMMRYAIDDIRLLQSGDLRFLNQF